MMRKAFTLIELLAVIGIMGLLGTISVGGYRAMQRGMEERGAIQNANQFIRSAYQRAQIDRVPVKVCFWNELIREETDNDPMIVVGRAVAVRCSGRISKVIGSDLLLDEFADLAAYRLRFNEDEDKEATAADVKSGEGMYLYNLEDMASSGQGGDFKRSVVAQSTARVWNENSEAILDGGSDKKILSYAYVIKDKNGCEWKVGSPYGFEFSEIRLAHNYLFGSKYSKDISKPVEMVRSFTFLPGDESSTASIEISSLRPDNAGNLTAQKVADTESPTQELKK